LDSSGSGQGSVVGSCKHGGEPSGSIKDVNFDYSILLASEGLCYIELVVTCLNATYLLVLKDTELCHFVSFEEARILCHSDALPTSFILVCYDDPWLLEKEGKSGVKCNIEL
jgi:hypothetical protein